MVLPGIVHCAFVFINPLSKTEQLQNKKPGKQLTGFSYLNRIFSTSILKF